MSVNKKEEKKNLLSRAPQIDPNGEKHTHGRLCVVRMMRGSIQ
jgi:hypothetical protein